MDSLSTLMLGGGFSVGMYRKAMSMHSAAGDGCNYCRCDDGHAIKGKRDVPPEWLAATLPWASS
jgi:hypothetical protein